MAKRRSSLKGRGSEILFGEPTPVDIEPRGPVTARDESVPVEPESVKPEPIEQPLEALAEQGTVDEPSTPVPEETKPPPKDRESAPEVVAEPVEDFADQDAMDEPSPCK